MGAVILLTSKGRCSHHLLFDDCLFEHLILGGQGLDFSHWEHFNVLFLFHNDIFEFPFVVSVLNNLFIKVSLAILLNPFDWIRIHNDVSD